MSAHASRSEHTPGPWYVGIDKKSVWSRDSSPGTEPCVARCIEPSREGTREQNARLIAAAPALLEALEREVEYSTDPWTRDRCRAAIRAAKGESA